MKSRTMKIDADEKALLESVERGEWKSAGGGKRESVRYSRSAKATFKKDRRLNIRLLSKDPGGDPEARARGRTALPDLDCKHPARVASGRLKEIQEPSPRFILPDATRVRQYATPTPR